MIFSQLVKQCGLPEPVKEFQFAKELGRKWRFDYCWPESKLALEVEGGVWTKGRHTRPKGFLKDVEKYNTATQLGWRILRTTPKELLTNKTIELLTKLI